MTAVEDRLAEFAALADAATAGPWIIDSLETGEYGLFVDVDPESLGLGCGSKQVAGFLIEPNAVFVAAARTFVPEAVAALRAVLAMHEPIWCNALNDYQCAECGADLTDATPNCPTVGAIAALGVTR